jgi:hypothetical protein
MHLPWKKARGGRSSSGRSNEVRYELVELVDGQPQRWTGDVPSHDRGFDRRFRRAFIESPAYARMVAVGVQTTSLALNEIRDVHARSVWRTKARVDFALDNFRNILANPFVAYMRLTETCQALNSGFPLGPRLSMATDEAGMLNIAIAVRSLSYGGAICDTLEREHAFHPVMDQVQAAEHAAELQAAINAWIDEASDSGVDELTHQDEVRDTRRQGEALREHLLTALESFPSAARGA